MFDIISDLEEDHRRFRRYLVWLTDEIEAFGRGNDVDYFFLRMLARYFSEYPDELHHKKEDIIYAALTNKLRYARVPLANLHAEHEALSIRAGRFREIIHDIVNDQELPRARVVIEAREYKAQLGNHMMNEDVALFAPARKHLIASDWDAVNCAIADLYAKKINFDKARSVRELERHIEARSNEAPVEKR